MPLDLTSKLSKPSFSKPTIARPSVRRPNLPRPSLSLGRGGGDRGTVVGLDIQPGYVTAVKAHVNGSIVVQDAAGAALPADAVREGEVLDEGVLSDTLRGLFDGGRFGKRVRVGVANQRTVLRILELPPVSDRKELAAAVRFQAEDQVPMPLSNAVLDFQSLGMVDTPTGPRQRVIVVAAQRDMVEHLLTAVRDAGLRPVGVDLSAFALIRSLYQPQPEGAGRVLYLNIGGLTNMAIAEGTVCRFTRIVGGGLEAMAAEVAERRGIPLDQARELLAAVDLSPAPVLPVVADLSEHSAPVSPEEVAEHPHADLDASDTEPEVQFHEGFGAPAEVGQLESWQLAQDPMGIAAQPAEPVLPPEVTQPRAVAPSDADVRQVLQDGIREIAGEVRNSLDFHRSQEDGGQVASIVLSGPALEIPGFADVLESDLGIAVRRESVNVAAGRASEQISSHRLAIAAGLAAEEVRS